MSARVQSECSLSITDFETLDKLSKMVLQVNNHLGTFLIGLDKVVKSFPAMAKGCLTAANGVCTSIITNILC